jgi:hypothetical protein
MSVTVTTNIPEVLNALGVVGDKMNAAARDALKRVGQAVEAQAVKNADTGSHPRGQGHIPGTGPGPNTMTRTLKQSIRSEDVGGFGDYKLVVGATTEYARAVEEGSPLWKSGVKYPYMRPAADKIRPVAYQLFTDTFVARLKG